MLNKNFTWGGASAANQYEGGYNEGGKGLNAVDVLTNGSNSEPRKVTWKKPNGETGATPLVWGADEFKLPEGAIPQILDDYYYPSHQAFSTNPSTSCDHRHLRTPPLLWLL